MDAHAYDRDDKGDGQYADQRYEFIGVRRLGHAFPPDRRVFWSLARMPANVCGRRPHGMPAMMAESNAASSHPLRRIIAAGRRMTFPK
jgi:hypothetical protein